MAGPTREFWEERFAAGNTPWDRGASSPQLASWLRAGSLKPCRILVPGCGSGYEVVDLALAGFEVTGLDYADEAISRTHRNLKKAGVDATLVQADVLAWEPDRAFDAVYEQTCLCALYPDQWREYADRLHRWLAPGGKLFALFMQWLREGASEGLIQGPPYHCDINAMRALFAEPRWAWGKPPYPRTEHPAGLAELAVVLGRR
ncbi:MAG: methyltransferase domain-containing protein [Burkholderiales bacterium]